MFLFSKYQTHIFETDTMVRIVFRLVRTHAVKLDSRRPYIQGEVKLQRVRHKIFDQTFQTENNVWTSILIFIPSDPLCIHAILSNDNIATESDIIIQYYLTCVRQNIQSKVF